VLTLSSLFARLTRNGRREARARKWDAIADRQAARRRVFAAAIAACTLTGESKPRMRELYNEAKAAEKAETYARIKAATIRKGGKR
jgi:hypothetical protein